MRDFIRQFLLYSRSERRAVIALSILIILVVIAPKAYRFYGPKMPFFDKDSTLVKEMAIYNQHRSTAGDSIADTDGKLFYFDPNKIGLAEWQQLGLSEKQAAVIEKYKGKGGRFRKPEDLRKIYVLSDEMKDRLIPYVQIADGDNNYYKYSGADKNLSPSFRLEINSAEAEAWEALPGIGPSMSDRIVNFRNLLGGFVRIDQVGETYGLEDSVFQRIRPHLTLNTSLVHKINIDTADYEELRRHPYIHAKIARAIIVYRNQNGKFDSIGEIRQLKQVSDIAYQKIRPYLSQ